MKRLLLFLLEISGFTPLFAQLPGTYTLPISTSTIPYYADNTIIRNYNNNYNIIMTHGEYPNTYCYNEYPPDIRNADRSHFYLQEISTGTLTHIVSLGCHYEVKDVRFVTLRRDDGLETPVTYCCFCGTHTADSAIEYGHAIGDEPVPITYIYAKRGFAGFFSMDDALSPTSTCTAKVRYVEGTRDLYRMVAYPEDSGHYFQYQTSYIDNAVLDIVGTPMNSAAPSCMARVKFYPDYPVSYYPSGTHWDNNIRYEATTQEVMTDIVATSDSIITASHIAGDSTTIWLRHSLKENHFHPGGLELEWTVYQLDMNSLNMGGWMPYTYEGQLYWKRYRLCEMNSDKYALSFFYMPRLFTSYGLIVNRYSINGGFTLLDGRYLKEPYMPGDMVYLSTSMEHALILDEYGGTDNKTAIISVDNSSPHPYQCTMLDAYPMRFSSLTYRNNSGNEVLYWGGLKSGGGDDSRVANEYETDCWNGINCMEQKMDDTSDASIDYNTDSYPFLIKARYFDNQINYPVNIITFDPYITTPEIECQE